MAATPSSLCFLLLLGAGSSVLLLLLHHLQEVTAQLHTLPGGGFPAPERTDAEEVLLAAVPVAPGTLDRRHKQRRSKSRSDSWFSSRQQVTKCDKKIPLRKSSAPAGMEEDLRLRLVHRQEVRKKQVRQVCGQRRPTGTAEWRLSQRQASRIYVEDRSRLLYCEVPKASCSNWKRVLMVLGGTAVSTKHISHHAAHYANLLRRLDSYKHVAAAARLCSYTKVLFVREPFQRLVSAFRDKFESPNSYYHPVFGRPIISRYRTNASRTALRTGAGVTFREFVQYLLDVRRPISLDVHWEPVSQLCQPCLIHYSFIGKVETLEEDANFLLHTIGAPVNLTFPDLKDRNPQAQRTSSAITEKYFSQLSAMERQKVYDFYYRDYLMFNYPKPFTDLH